jgi:GNAT superfamily N-acetyltransferase
LISIVPLAGVAFADWLPLWLDYISPQITDPSLPLHSITFDRLRNGTSDLHGIAAVSGSIVGFAHFYFHPSTWATSEACYLQDLYVVSSARGRRIGQTLIQAVAERARARGCHALNWRAQESNAPAHRLYARLAERTNRASYHMPIHADKHSADPSDVQNGA